MKGTLKELVEKIVKDKCPTGKVKFKFEKDAWMAAYKWFQGKKVDTSVYLCNKCRFYHLTSKKGYLPMWLLEIIDSNK